MKKPVSKPTQIQRTYFLYCNLRSSKIPYPNTLLCLLVYSDDVSVCSQFWHACTTYGHIIKGRGCRHAYLDFCWAKIDFQSQYRLWRHYLTYSHTTNPAISKHFIIQIWAAIWAMDNFSISLSILWGQIWTPYHNMGYLGFFDSYCCS